MRVLFDVLVFAGGYTASVYSWPLIKVWVNGVTVEVASLRAKAASLEARIKAL